MKKCLLLICIFRAILIIIVVGNKKYEIQIFKQYSLHTIICTNPYTIVQQPRTLKKSIQEHIKNIPDHKHTIQHHKNIEKQTTTAGKKNKQKRIIVSQIEIALNTAPSIQEE